MSWSNHSALQPQKHDFIRSICCSLCCYIVVLVPHFCGPYRFAGIARHKKKWWATFTTYYGGHSYANAWRMWVRNIHPNHIKRTFILVFYVQKRDASPAHFEQTASVRKIWWWEKNIIGTQAPRAPAIIFGIWIAHWGCDKEMRPRSVWDDDARKMQILSRLHVTFDEKSRTDIWFCEWRCVRYHFRVPH